MNAEKYSNILKNLDNIFVSDIMKQVINSLKIFAQNEESILLEGESGTGKDTFAYFIYLNYPKSPKFIQTVNCYAITDSILVDILNSFLHQSEKRDERITYMLYFNDIIELGLSAQNYLLHFIEEYESSKSKNGTLLKFISSTTSSIQDLIDSNFVKFKSELYYRLSSQTIYIPPLRERPEDIMPLFKFFVQEFQGNFTLSNEVEDIFLNYPWPGNMRELANTAKQLSLLKVDKIEKKHLPQTIVRYFER